MDLSKLKQNNRENSRNGKYFGPIFVLAIPVSAFLLGTWQVKRRKWKADLIRTLESRTQADPTELPQNLADLNNTDNEYRCFKVKGKFDRTKEIVITTRNDLTGQLSGPGGYLITPFKLTERNLTILVNRGFVPYTRYSDLPTDDNSSNSSSKISDEMEIIGLLRFNEIPNNFTPANNYARAEWHHRDIDNMSQVLNTSPIFLDLREEYTLNRKTGPIGGQTNINLRNEHLSYIITWYSLSAITSYMWFKNYANLLFRK
jgi:surfeit locus 1 family protein